MVRDLRGESEFGLPVLPGIGLEGEPVEPGAGLPALTDAQAIKDGAVGQEAGPVGSVTQLGYELREIYAKGEGTIGPGSVANSQFRP